MLNVEVKWGPRFGKPFDHGFLSVIWRWKTKQKRKKRNGQTLRSWTTNHGPSLIPGCESNYKQMKGHLKMKWVTLSRKQQQHRKP